MSMLSDCTSDLLRALSVKAISPKVACSIIRMWDNVMDSNQWSTEDIERSLNYVADHKDTHDVVRKAILGYLKEVYSD